MTLTLYQHHLPYDVRIFRYLSKPVRIDDEVIICDGWYADISKRYYCRSYMFLKRWLHVFAVFDHKLFPTEESQFEGFNFAFNCDITTPHYMALDNLYTTDLCVDILVSASGRKCLIKDQEELTAMHTTGQLGDIWRDAAINETLWIKDIVSRGNFIEFLERIAPFPSVAIESNLSQMTECALEDCDFIFHPSYPRYA
jgi:hypothetical protein